MPVDGPVKGQLQGAPVKGATGEKSVSGLSEEEGGQAKREITEKAGI